MIALTARLRKGRIYAHPLAIGLLRTAFDENRQPVMRHGIVSLIIMPPYFRPPRAVLGCDKICLRWPGPFDTGFLSPQPPGVVGTGSSAEY